MAGGAGLKMVLIMECLGKANLRSYIGLWDLSSNNEHFRKFDF